ncbi:phytanoyl-CoA dioxygenase [Pseudomonas aeruginosa]|nr:phytanoyl-CoA dioxygenase [Pseudomonas aeruginosa]
MSASRDTFSLPVVTRSTPAQEIALLSDQAGAVIIRNFMTPEQVARINNELDAPLARSRPLQAPARADRRVPWPPDKRLTNLVTHSKTFREEILDDDLFHDLGNVLYAAECGDWWLTTAQLIEIGPGNKAQMLHRDMAQYQPFVAMNKHAPRTITNLMLALTDFTEENGGHALDPREPGLG